MKAVTLAFPDTSMARADLKLRIVQQRVLEDFGGFEWESKASSVVAVHGRPQCQWIRQARSL